MGSVDNRVVQMQFRNEKFMESLRETMGSLDKLKGQLNFSGDAKGLDSVAAGFKGIDVNHVTAGIEGLSNRFLAMKAVALTVVSEITSAFLNLGTRLAKEIINPEAATAGFREYEMKMGAIQVMMAGSGESLEVVNQKLRELNEYSDRTIYSFADMTSNIGKFTNAGVDLETSVKAIQGVANVAARSGASAEEASRAMYNFGQALGMGVVRLEDWRSINLANMGTAEFKQQLIDSAEAMGTLTKQGDQWVTKEGTLISATKGFEQSLQDQWLTSEALIETLNRYSDTTTEIGAAATQAATEVKTFSQMLGVIKETMGSGFATTAELIFGDYNESKELFTFMNSMFSGWVNESANARNALLKDWKDIGGRTKLFEGIGHAIVAVEKVVRALGKAWSNVFPPATGGTLLLLTVRFENLMEKLIPGPETLAKLTDVFTGLFSILKLGFAIVKTTFSVLGDLFGLFSGTSNGGILSAAAAISRLVTSFVNFVTEGDKLQKIGDAIVKFFVKVKDALSPLGQVFSAVGAAMQRLGEIVKAALVEAWGDAADDIDRAGQKITEVFATVKNKLQSFADDVTRLLDGLFQSGGGSGGGAGGEGGGMFDGIKNFLSGGLDGVQGAIDKAKGVFATLGQMLDDVKGFAKSLFSAIGEGDWNQVDALLKRLVEGGAVAALLIFAKKLGEGFSILIRLKVDLSKSVTDLLDGLTGSLKAMQNKLQAEALKEIAIAIAILAAAALVLSLIPAEKLAKAMSALAVGFGQMVGSMVLLTKFTGGGQRALALSASLILMAGSMLIFAAAVSILGGMDLASLAKGVGAIAAILGVVLGFAVLMKKYGKDLDKTSVSLISMGIGLLLITRTIAKFGEMDTGTLIQGILAFATVMAIITASVTMMPDNMAEIGVGLIGIGFGLMVITASISKLGEMDLAALNQGLLGFAAIMLILAGTLALLPEEKMIELGVGLVAVGVGIYIVSKAVGELGSMKLGDLAKGVGGLLATLLILALGLHLMETTFMGAAALMVASAAIFVLAKALQEMGSMKFTTILKGLLGLALVIAVFAAAAYLLMPVIPAMLLLGAALLLIGAGFALLGAGAYLATEAFKTLSTIGPEGLKNVMNAAKQLMTLLPDLFAALAEAFIEFLKTILEQVPTLVPLVVEAMGSILEGLEALIPKAVAVVVALISALIDAIVVLYPKIVEAGYEILLRLLQGIRDRIGEIVTTVGDIIAEFLTALSENMEKIIEAGVQLLVSLLEGITKYISTIAPVAAALITELITQLGNLHQSIIDAGLDVLENFLLGITENLGKIIAAVGRLIGQLVIDLAKEAVRLQSAGLDALEEFLAGTANNIVEFADAAWQILTDFLNALAGVIASRSGELRSAGWNIAKAIASGASFGLSEFIPGLKVDGAKMGAGIEQGAKESVKAESPSQVFREIGNWIGEGMSIGIRESTSGAVSASKALAAATITAMNLAIDDVNPTITPVLDLSLVRSGAQGINSILGGSSIAAASTLSWNSTDGDSVTSGVGGLTFTQIINAPKQLSTGDIYRQTKSQLALAREELS